MCQVLEFRPPARKREPGTEQMAEQMAEHLDIDLLSAVDFALRDIADITRHIVAPEAREQAEACRRMLQDAFNAALRY